MKTLEFYKGKKVLITGHTGFKGTWLSKILINAGAEVSGYALNPPHGENLFGMCGVASEMTSIIGDIRNLEQLQAAFAEVQPEIVFHMAAQPIVRDSYKDPVYTYETNVMGTVNILECLRNSKSVKSFVNITTDKVYENKEWCWGYREDENLCGFDPYSNSKSCSELVTYSYLHSFFSEEGSVNISTARSGNVIGGGDFANDRIIPDCIRAALKGESIIVRNPHSTRPYQHVLECLSGYLLLAYKQYNDKNYAGNYNFGPNDESCVTTGTLVDVFCEKWGHGQSWENKWDGGPHEANFLKLDCTKSKQVLGWTPNWNINMAIEKTIEFTKAVANGRSTSDVVNEQVKEYFK